MLSINKDKVKKLEKLRDNVRPKTWAIKYNCEDTVQYQGKRYNYQEFKKNNKDVKIIYINFL